MDDKILKYFNFYRNYITFVNKMTINFNFLIYFLNTIIIDILLKLHLLNTVLSRAYKNVLYIESN